MSLETIGWCVVYAWVFVAVLGVLTIVWRYLTRERDDEYR